MGPFAISNMYDYGVRRVQKLKKIAKRLNLSNYNVPLLTILLIPVFLYLRSIITTTVTQSSKPISSCHGKYIYIKKLPSQFNQDLLENCKTTYTSWTHQNMCPYVKNMGFGRKIQPTEEHDALTKESWYLTNSYSLSVIFHNRMKSYECLTNDSSSASAVYVPYYAGLDASRHLWSKNMTLKDQSAKEFAKWVKKTPEWKTMYGMDHFFVSGRTGWDYRRVWGSEIGWGTRLRLLPESKNMSMLTMEFSIWNNDFAVPYPTSFHPSTVTEVRRWQENVRNKKRDVLFSFIGAKKPSSRLNLRDKIVEECRSSEGLCKILECDYDVKSFTECDNPNSVMKFMQNSVFCLHPRGGSYTRRSFFDSIMAGCIPVMFHHGSAYTQYKWYLPKNHSLYSVYIPIEDEASWTDGLLTETLRGFTEAQVNAMREEVIRLIPKIVYYDGGSRVHEEDDAFDIAVNNILERIQKVRNQVKAREDPTTDFGPMDDKKFHISHYPK